VKSSLQAWKNRSETGGQAVLSLVFFISSSIYRAVKKQFHYSLFATELMVLAYYGLMLRPLGIVLI
tara:strand:- start:673 stop:870 length:198 start_codon:yes stop_codon:yes gene_type:complete